MNTFKSKWTSRTEVDPGLSHSLDLLADTYNYNHWVYSLCRPWLGKRIMEVGSGIGNMTQFMLGADRLACVEPESDYHNALSEISQLHKNVIFYSSPLQEVDSAACGYDSIVCVNVLEHIEDDRAALIDMARHLRVGGYLVLYVPAVSWAFGEMDKMLGHYRRYYKKDIKKLINGTCLIPVHSIYVNLLGLFGWWWSGRVQKEQLININKAKFMDSVVPFVSALERIIPVPVGQSLLFVMQKT